MRRAFGVLAAGLLCGLVACGDDGTGSPEKVLKVQDVVGPIVEREGNVWVLNGDDVSEFDGTTHEVVATSNLGSAYVRSLDSLHGALWVNGMSGITRLDPDTGATSSADGDYDSLASVGDRLFGSSDGDLHELDPATGADLGPVTLPLNENGYDYEVVQVPLVAVGDTLWVTVAEDDFSFTAFDPAAGTFGAKVEVDETYGSAVLVGDVIWLADRYGHAVIVDATTGEVLDDSITLPAGETILDDAGSLFAGSDDTLWFLDQPTQNVYQLDPLTGEVLGSFHLQRRPSAMAVTTTELWFTNRYDDSISVLPRTAMKAPAE